MGTDSAMVVHEEPVRQVVPEAGTLALALMSDGEFNARLEALKKGQQRMAEIQKSLMVEDVDYGTIPGTDKPTLLKPGAEKLNNFYGYAADFFPSRTEGDGKVAPHLSYQTRCDIHLGSLDGPVVAVGYGSANSWEKKHRYRSPQRACPDCGVVGAITRSTREPEWFCWRKKGGCGATYPLDEPRIIGQVGDRENPDPHELDNTLLKMSEKRSYIDGTLRATASSGLFTQDMDDQPQEGDEGQGEGQDTHEDEQRRPPRQTQRTRQSTTPGRPEAQPATQTQTATGTLPEYCLADGGPRGTKCMLPPAHPGEHRNRNGHWTTGTTQASAAEWRREELAEGLDGAPIGVTIDADGQQL